MRIFVSKTSNTLNKKIYDVENISNDICLNPMYKSVSISKECNILMDSGAFQNEERRVSFEESLKRQLLFGIRIGRPLGYISSYDKINDKKETMRANKFLIDENLEGGGVPVLITQGKNEFEYIECLKEIVQLSESRKFVLGFGGIAKSGIDKKLEKKLFGSIKSANRDFGNIQHIHLFGVFTNRILERTRSEVPSDINLSCDTASIEIRSVMGNVFEQGRWVKTFSRPQKYIDYDPNLLAKENVSRAIEYYNKL